MTAKNWTKLYAEYPGKWVALEGDEVTVITSGQKLKDVMAEAKRLGYARPLMTKVPNKNLAHIGLRATKV